MIRRPCLLAVAALLAVLAPAASAGPSDSLRASFVTPPASARPWVYWFWLNGNITREGITADLEAMKRVGVGGVLIMEVDQGAPVGPVDFASPKWRELFAFMVSEAHRLGIEVNMNDDAGWNGSGGPWITPDTAMQRITWSETAVTGGSRFDAVLPQPPTVRSYYRDIAVLAYPTPAEYRIQGLDGKTARTRGDMASPANYPELPVEQTIAQGKIVDLTAKVGADGRLTWDAPAGNWTVVRIGHTLTGAVNAPAPLTGQGLECDKLSKEGSEAAFDGLMGKLIADVGPLAGKTLVRTHIDSWENGSQNWTPRFREEFKRLRGYDMTPYLPVLTGRVVDSLEVSERFLYDMRLTVSDLLIENYAQHFSDMAKKHGMALSIEAYGDTTVDDIAYGGRADEPMGEFWSSAMFGAGNTLIEMSSSAHLYNKPIVGAEAFTADDRERWLLHPGSIKMLGDWAFAAGINRFVFHRYALQPWVPERKPGMTMGPWGLHYERTNTWWEQSGAWHQYLSRCQYLLQRGLPVVDALYVQPEGAPRSYNPPATTLRAGYHADGCPAEIVLKRLSVKNGRLVLPHGMSYRVLVLPTSETMTPELLKRVKELVAQGATVIGPKPLKSPSLAGYPACDDEVAKLAAELWGSGKIITGKTPEQVLAAKGVAPDMRSPRNLNWIHKTIDGAEVYFVANPGRSAINVDCEFRVTGRAPELWRPDTGRIEQVAAFTQKGGVTKVPLRFDASGSVFVVFRPGSKVGDPIVRMTHGGKDVWTRRKAPIPYIIKATWGATGRIADVTEAMQQLANEGQREFAPTKLGVGDPASGVAKQLRVEYQIDGQDRAATCADFETLRLGTPEEARKPVKIVRATWGPPGEKSGMKDVTDQVQRKVAGGLTSFQVAELVSEGDPVPMVVKTLRVEYEVEGRKLVASAQDPEEIAFEMPGDDEPPAAVRRASDGSLEIEATTVGELALRTRSGKTYHAEAPAAWKSGALEGPWDVAFTPGWGAPASIVLPSLISWSEHTDPGVKYFSGTATYRTDVTLLPGLFRPRPGKRPQMPLRIYLDLGRVEVMADVTVNGRHLGTLWKTPYRVDVTSALKPGKNDLEIRVTNLWPNRMIGDEQLAEDSARNPDGTLREWPKWLQDGKPSPTGRYTFTSWRLFRKGSPLLPSGLLGPVTLQASPVVRIPAKP